MLPRRRGCFELIHAQSEHVSFNASATRWPSLASGRWGIPAVALNVSPASAGYVLDLQTDPRQALAATHPLRTIEHQREEAPKEPESKRGKPASRGASPRTLQSRTRRRPLPLEPEPWETFPRSGQRATPPFPGLSNWRRSPRQSDFSTDKQKGKQMEERTAAEWRETVSELTAQQRSNKAGIASGEPAQAEKTRLCGIARQ